MRKSSAIFAGLWVVVTLAAVSGAAESTGQNSPDVASTSGVQSNATPAVSDPNSNITNEQIKDALVILREFDQDQAQRLADHWHDNPKRVRATIAPLMPKLIQFNYLKTHDPELYKYRMEDYKMGLASMDLATEYRKAVAAADKAKADAAMTQLKAIVTKQFAIRQKMMEHDIAIEEAKITRMKEKIQARKAIQDQLIADHVKELTADQPQW